MNATYVAIGAAFVAISATMLAQSTAASPTPDEDIAAEDTAAKDTAAQDISATGRRLASAMFMVAGAIFIMLGLLSNGD